MTLSQKHLAGFIWFRTVLNALSRHLELSLCTEVWSLPSRVPGRESPSLELDWKSTHFQLHDLWIECCMLSKFLVHLQKAPQNFRSHSHICCTSSANSIQPITMKAVPLWGGWSLVDLSSWKASLSFGQLSRDMPGRPSHSVRSDFVVFARWDCHDLAVAEFAMSTARKDLKWLAQGYDWFSRLWKVVSKGGPFPGNWEQTAAFLGKEGRLQLSWIDMRLQLYTLCVYIYTLYRYHSYFIVDYTKTRATYFNWLQVFACFF